MGKFTAPLIKQGWLRALLFVLPWLGVSYLLDVAGSALTLNALGLPAVEMGDNFQTIIKYLVSALGTLLLVWLWRKIIDRQTFKSLGFEWKGFSNDAGIGFFLATALLGFGTIVLVALSYLQYGDVTFKPKQIVIEVFFMLLVAFSEELVIRGYLLNNLLKSMNKWLALGLSAALFALLHLANPDASVLSILNILAAGFFLGINYIYTKNLWFGIFLHFAWNFFQGPIFGFEVSGIKLTALFQQNLDGPTIWTGGPFGFEGSLLCPILTIAATIILARFYAKQYPASQQIAR